MGSGRRGSDRRARAIDPWFVGVLVLSAAAICWKVAMQGRIGPQWDTYAFLCNAAEFAGRSIGYSEPHRPPVMAFLTSLVFRVAPMGEYAIEWVDGALTLLGAGALYALARRRMAGAPAALAALALFVFPPVWEWIGVGYSDTASVSIVILALLVFVKSTEDDPRFYLLAFPVLTVAFVTRYTSLLAVFAVAILLLLRARPFAHARHIAGGIALGFLAYAPVALYYNAAFGDILYPFATAFSAVSEQAARGTTVSVPEPTGWTPALVVACTGIGMVALAGLWARIRGSLRKPSGAGRVLVTAGAVALAVAAQFGGGVVARQISIGVAMLAVFRLAAPRQDDQPDRTTASAALDAAFLCLLLAYVDFHGHQPVKVGRYLIMLAAPIAYLLPMGWAGAASAVAAFRTRWRIAPAWASLTEPRLGRIATGVLGVAVAGVLAGAAGNTVAIANGPSREPVAGARLTADWLAAEGVDPWRSVVYSDLWPMTSWYLRGPSRVMPVFMEAASYRHELEKSRGDFYVTVRETDFGGLMKEVARFGPAGVLASTDATIPVRPRIAYAGKAWDNYVERLDGFAIDLIYEGGREGAAGSVYLDHFTPQRLAREFDGLAIYNVRWRDRAAAWGVAERYARDGGVVVLDASGNLGSVAYPLADSIVFDTVIRRRSLDPNARVTVSDGLLARHPELAGLTSAPWRTETGGAWFGADYEAAPGSTPPEVLATVGDRPLVAVRRIGKGRVYLVAYNLFWHAFNTGSRDEAILTRAVLDEAYGPAPGSGTP